MPEELDSQVDLEKDSQVDPEKGKAREEKPTLDSLAEQNKKLNEKLDKVLQQNLDKDEHIKTIQGENKDLREKISTISSSLIGKSEEKKDAEFEEAVKELAADGYDEGKIRNLLKVQVRLAQREANQRVVPIIMEAVEEAIDSDPEIDKKFVKDNQADITAEYNSYKQETSPRKIKANFKKAVNIVKERLAEEARAKETPEEKAKREAMVRGAGAPDKGKKTGADEQDKFLDGIEKAGSPSGHFI